MTTKLILGWRVKVPIAGSNVPFAYLVIAGRGSVQTQNKAPKPIKKHEALRLLACWVEDHYIGKLVKVVKKPHKCRATQELEDFREWARKTFPEPPLWEVREGGMVVGLLSDEHDAIRILKEGRTHRPVRVPVLTK